MKQHQRIQIECRHIVLALILLTFGPMLTGCGNDADPGDVRFLANSAPAREHATVQSELAALYILVNHTVQQFPAYGNGLEGYLPSCATLRWDTTGGKRLLSVILPDTGCLCVDGIRRSGQVAVDLKQGWRGAGAQATVTLSDYQAGSLVLGGGFSVKAIGGGSVNYEHTVTTNLNGILLNGQALFWNGTYTFTQVLGRGTVSFFDDDFRLVGSAQGESTTRKPFTVAPRGQVADNAVTSCRNLVQGESTVTTADFTMQLTYDPAGLGQCDEKAYVDVGPNDKGNFVIR